MTRDAIRLLILARSSYIYTHCIILFIVQSAGNCAEAGLRSCANSEFHVSFLSCIQQWNGHFFCVAEIAE